MHVLINGAGVAGSTLAWWLARTGARVTVLEKNFSALGQGQNIDVNGSALAVVRKMGLMEVLQKFHTGEKGTQFVDSGGKPFASFPRTDRSSISLTSEFEVLRGDLSTLLYEAAKEQPNVEYKFGNSVKNVVHNNETSVKVEMTSGEIKEYDLLVAADGQWSRLRKELFPKDDITVLDKNLYVVYWTIPRLPEDNDFWNIYVGLNRRIMGIRPDPHGTYRTLAARMPMNDEQKKAWEMASRADKRAQMDLMLKEFSDMGWQSKRILDSMEGASDFYFHALQQIQMKNWSTGRVVCLGDAAWAPTPLAGAGASLALNGAYVLAGELSKLAPGEHPSKALNAYDNAFRPWVEKTQHVPSFAPGIGHPTNAIQRAFMHVFLRIVAKVAQIPWIVKRLNGDSDAIDFPLPDYPSLPENTIQHTASLKSN